jgi:RHS repeat-associated protein
MILGALLLSLSLPSTPPPSAALLSDFPPTAVASNTSPFDVSVDLKPLPPSLATRLSQSGTPTGPRPYFGARYYGSKIGRFTTTDPAYTIQDNLVDPQRWNKYAYARNNPLRYADPDGREVTYANGALQTYFGSLAAWSPAVRATLALYEGANNPNLFVGQAKDLGKEEGKDTGGGFTPTYGAFTTDSPPGSNKYPGLDGLSDAQIKDGLHLGSLMTSIALASGTIELRSDLSLNVTSMFRGKAEQQTLGIALHELGHADDAASKTLGFYRNAHNPAELAKHHDDRQVEKNANSFRDAALRDFPR